MAGNPPLVKPEVKAPPPKVFNCPSCGAGVIIRALGQTVSVVCGSCGSIIDSTNENYKILSTFSKKLKIEPVIPIGQRGKFRGIVWEVIGYMQRCDGSGAYVWSEYLLFSPGRGFRWLTEIDGHWNFVTMTKDKPTLSKKVTAVGNDRSTAEYLGKTYYLFNQGSAKVKYVIGEFYWRVHADEKVDVEDYVSPPYVLSCEKTKDEIVWSIGDYVTANDIKEAFQVLKPMPIQTGVAPNQLSTISDMAPGIEKYWGIFLAILLAIQIGTAMRAKNEQVYRGEFEYNQFDPVKTKASPQFELKDGLANVDFQLYSPVQNNWLEVAVDLVNDKTGETYEFEQGVEHYSGYDSDGSWEEGSTLSHKILSSIPDGLYHMNIEASAGATVGQQQTGAPYLPTGQKYSITVTRDVVTSSNFFWAALLLSIFPLFVWWRSRSFEHSRWSTSDFSPYWSSQGDDN